VQRTDADTTEEVVVIAGRDLTITRPVDADALLDERAFGREEFMPYWAELWPSARALARRVGTRALRGARVLELGCGLALPSLAAARAGARVLATDGAPEAAVFAAHVLALNEVDAEVAHASFETHGDALVDRGPWDVVLAADVLYTQANARQAARLLPRLLAPGGEVRLADPERAGARDFLALARGAFTVRTARADGVALHRLRAR
jgi:predicted nicotinamide N-methyase